MTESIRKMAATFGGRVFPHQTFLDIQRVDNSRFFVDKYLPLWRSHKWAKNIQFLGPPDIGNHCNAIQDVDGIKMGLSLWIACGYVLPDLSTGRDNSVRGNRP
jgi:hypothetical protein